jgi:hypothetical protein
MRSIKRWLTGGLAVVLLGLLLLANVRLHRPGGMPTARAQLRHLERSVRSGGPAEMQTLFPEGYVFTWALYGITSARVAATLPPGDADRAHLLAEARRSLAAIRSETGRSTFEQQLKPAYGAYYASWTLYTMAEYVRAAGPGALPPEHVTVFTAECDRFAQALAEYGSPFLESYEEQVWPADTAPGIAALAIHDAVVGPRYAGVVRRWVAEARRRVDPRTGALTHTAEPLTGRPTGVPRGESLALMSRILVDIDSIFAREQYALLREHFLADVLGVPGMLEYPRGMVGSEDMDTGPLIFGFSGPAIVVGAAAARANGDGVVANALLGGVELAGVPVQLGGRRWYALGKLPVGDAFIAWTRTTPLPPQSQRGWPPVQRWFLPFHAISAMLATPLLWIALWSFTPRGDPRGRPSSARLRSPR